MNNSANKNMTASVRISKISEGELTLASERGLDLTASIDAQLEIITKNTNDAYLLLIDAGLLLINVQEKVGDGSFKAELEKRGIAERRAYEMIRYARFAAQLPDKQRAKLGQIAKTKAMLLASADDEVVETYLGDEEGLENLKGLTVRELKQALSDKDKQLADVNVQNDTLKLQLKAHKQSASDGAPDFFQRAQIESCALNHKAKLCVDDLITISHNLMDMPDDPDRDRALKILNHSLNELSVYLFNAHKSISFDLPSDVWSTVEALDALCDDSAIKLAGDYSLITQEHRHETLLREQQAAMNAPKKRGRPAKTGK